MGKFDADAAAALDLIKEVGALVTFSRDGVTAFDPVTQERTTSAASGSLYCVEIPAGKSSELKIGSLVGRNVVQLYIARSGSSFEPKVGDAFTWGGAVYAIIPPLTHYNPAGDGPILTVAHGER